MNNNKELKNQLVKLADQLQVIVNKAKSENDRGLTSDERTAFHKLEADFTGIEDTIKANERTSTIVDSLAKVDGGKISETQLEEVQDSFRVAKKQTPHSKAFNKYLRFGMQALDQDEKKVMNFVPNVQNAQTSVTTAGGYLIPTGFSDKLEEAMLWFGGIEGNVSKMVTETGNPIPYPTVDDVTNKGRIIGQNVQVTETDFVFGQVTFGAYIFSSDLVLIPLSLIEDSYFDLDALTARLLGTRLGRLYNNKMTVGSGTGEPTGIVTAAIAAGLSDTFPVGQTISVLYGSLVDIESAVNPAYRSLPTSKWMFSDNVLKGLKKLVDTAGRPLWQPGIMSSFRDGAGVDSIKPSILDHTYIINNDMSSGSANADTVLFGDMSKYMVREVGGTTVLRLAERYADYLQVGFTAFRRADGNLLDAGSHPIAVGIQSAT